MTDDSAADMAAVLGVPMDEFLSDGTGQETKPKLRPKSPKK